MKGKAYPMIGLEIINLLFEKNSPQVFAKEFYHVQVIDEARPIPGESE